MTMAHARGCNDGYKNIYGNITLKTNTTKTNITVKQMLNQIEEYMNLKHRKKVIK